VNKAVNDDVAWSSRGVMPVVFYDNVFTGLDLSFTTRAAGGEVREESLSVFPDRGMSSSHAGEIGTVTNFIRPYLHQFSIDSHGLNGYGKPLEIPFDRYQSRLEAINNGRDIRQINW